jgi:hypothetical protein
VEAAGADGTAAGVTAVVPGTGSGTMMCGAAGADVGLSMEAGMPQMGAAATNPGIDAMQVVRMKRFMGLVRFMTGPRLALFGANGFCSQRQIADLGEHDVAKP